MWDKFVDIVAGGLIALLAIVLVCIPIGLWLGGIAIFVFIVISMARCMGVQI